MMDPPKPNPLLPSASSSSLIPPSTNVSKRDSVLEGLLLVNSLVTIGSGLCSMFAPRLIANPTTWTFMKEEEWKSGPIVIGLRNLFGCASMSLGVASLIAYLRPHEKVTTPVLASLSFYHITVIGPVLADSELFQIPEVLIHGVLGLGFIKYALKEV